MTVTQLGVFAKYWQPGKVKTRLAASVGDEAASELYRQFLLTTLTRFAGVAERQVLGFTPPDRRGEFAALAGERWTLWSQGEGDLGVRMRAYFQAALNGGATRVVLIGSDSPSLPIQYAQKAFDLLAEKPVVLGPARDGGYYLLGMAGEVAPVFDDIAWSTSRVWTQTIEQLEHHGIAYHVLPQWYDIDHADDLERLKTQH